MRIAYLVAGNDSFGGGATVRDAAFVRGMLNAGHEVDAFSLYGYASIEGETRPSDIFTPLGRHSLSRIFPRLTKVPKILTSFSHLVRPVDNMTSIAVTGRRFDPNGPLVVDLLSGANKTQRSEFSRLMESLGRKPGKIEVVVLANLILSGLAEAVRANIGCPIVCLSQGSDRIIESLEEPFRSDARKLVRKNSRYFRRVISSSRYFAIRATESLALPASRIKVVPPGVDAKAMDNPAPRKRIPFTIGYMAPIQKERGLDILLDAVDGLLNSAHLDLELWIAGKVVDERYWSRLNRRMKSSSLESRRRIFGSLAGKDRRDFMEGLSVFVVSSREPESRATHLLEAMAAGVPVVGPATGIIPEIFQHANGGLLVPSEVPAWMLTQALELLATMPDTADEMGRIGSEGVNQHFSMERVANHLIQLIENELDLAEGQSLRKYAVDV